MPSFDHHSGIGFLLSFGALPIAACPSNGDDGGTNASGPTTTDPTSSADADADVDTGNTDTGALPPGCVGLPVPAACTAWEDKYAECYPGHPEQYELYALNCACLIGYLAPQYSATCPNATEDLFACLSTQSCNVIMGGDPFCDAESIARDAACEGG